MRRGWLATWGGCQCAHRTAGWSLEYLIAAPALSVTRPFSDCQGSTYGPTGYWRASFGSCRRLISPTSESQVRISLVGESCLFASQIGDSQYHSGMTASDFHKAFKKLVDQSFGGAPEKFRQVGGGSSGYISDIYNGLKKPRVRKLRELLKNAKIEPEKSEELLKLLSLAWAKRGETGLIIAEWSAERKSVEEFLGSLLAFIDKQGDKFPQNIVDGAKALKLRLKSLA